MKYDYCVDEFIYETCWSDNGVQSTSKFDATLQSMWQDASDRGVLRYTLNIKHSKTLPGNFSFVAQLNTDRAQQRRAPQEIQSLTQPVDPAKFNFTKINGNEILFELKGGSDKTPDKHFILANISPFEFGSSLLIPSRLSCLPQIVTQDSVQLAIEVLLLSGNPAFRVGFNSLCGYATVNHLHYHLYYLHHSMLLEHIPVYHLSGPCFILEDYPAKGFVFELAPCKCPQRLARDVYKLTSFLQQSNVAHNLYITRGTRLTSCSTDSKIRNTVRVYVWARKSSSGAKHTDAFTPALCELFGHLIIKTEAFYWSITENQVVETLSDLCEGLFEQLKDGVKKLFSE